MDRHEHDPNRRDDPAPTAREAPGEPPVPTTPPVVLTADERKAFDEISGSMPALGALGPRRCRSARIWAGAALAISGALLGVASLGRLPVVVPFAGFVVSLVGISEGVRHALDAKSWQRIKAALGLEPLS